MPSPERGGPHPEQALPRYHRAVRFQEEQPAGAAYLQAQETIYQAECDLSVFRLLLDQAWHVAVLGEPPPQELEQQLDGILASGEPATLPTEVVKLLHQRRTQSTKLGLWVQRHHRPGQPLA